jgi:hypothetical protein
VIGAAVGAAVYAAWNAYVNVQQGQPWYQNIGVEASKGLLVGVTLGLAGPSLAGTGSADAITSASLATIHTATRLVHTGDVDEAARSLARRLGGQASVSIEGFAREFDVVSRLYVAQTTSARSALVSPDNFLNAARREQIRATLEAARATGRKAYFEFRSGAHDEVLRFIRRNADRMGADFEIHR